jgi:phosphatidylethanolamine-binding protein (PEBP) family uncharacterized protein
MLPMALTLALTACSASSAPKSVTIAFKSPAVVHYALPARYTCDGADVAPPLEWGQVPAATRELALFMLELTPSPRGHGYRTTVAWALAGVNPQLHKLGAGELPPGSHMALTSSGKELSYSVCPARGQTQKFQFALYAVPASVTVPDAFVGIKLLAVLADPESADYANAGGAFVARFTRGGHTAASRQPSAKG